jgi:hypothetical protein
MDNKYYAVNKPNSNAPSLRAAEIKNLLELNKKPSRTEIINFILSLFSRNTSYLEIGVRNPHHNFSHIKANNKYSVDPGLEFKENPVDFKLTSDEFFEKLNNNEILSPQIKFDVIFIDGLHLAEQVDRDIKNAMDYIKEDGFIVLHDCNPPTEWHARTDYSYHYTPAGMFWNGTTWKAFLKWRFNANIQSCCINSDWGVGILSKSHKIGQSIEQTNQFYEFSELIANRKEYLNLLTFDDFKKLVSGENIHD